MSALIPGSHEWLAQVNEPSLEPDLPIIDPHHHLWPTGGALPYGIQELHADADSGHNIVQTVFMECGSSYDMTASADLAPVGETRFVADVSKNDPRHLITGIVGHIDVRLPHRDDLLDAHIEAGNGLFRGVRDALARADFPEGLLIPGHAEKDLYKDADFVTGVRRLGERGLTYDSWHYHFQNGEFLALAQAAPETTMVLDHFGTPLLAHHFAGHEDVIFEQWKKDITAIATCSNVVAKVGGIAMPDNGLGWHEAERPPTSDEYVARVGKFYSHIIEAFGPERCMLESNFPIDRFSVSYNVMWNAMKKMTAQYSATERTSLFSGTAQRIYKLPAVG
jgi:predicted TIM-barrel fold metal-dependent hydrolase